MNQYKQRCPWPGTDQLYVNYHDTEWGVPLYNDNKLFEFLSLESAQAGLSWYTILKKRENYREAFKQLDPIVVAKFTQRDIDRLMQNVGIVRNLAKIKAAINNASAFIEIQKEFGSFSIYQWQFVDGAPKINSWNTLKDIPTITQESETYSKDLKKRGFKFLGPTTIYAHMQASGMVNDHLVNCPRYLEVQNNNITS
jgi:DNA-3-methyladenine glycosylase I